MDTTGKQSKRHKKAEGGKNTISSLTSRGRVINIGCAESVMHSNFIFFHRIWVTATELSAEGLLRVSL